MNISGNTILITGGTSGLGLAFAEEFLAAGSTVIICGRRADRLEAIKEKYPQIVIKKTDLADELQRQELYDWTAQNYPAVNILMNNAGMQLASDLTQPVSLDKVRLEMETNLIAPMHLSSLFAGHLSKQANPAVINISSGLAFSPLAFMPVYCASKAALHSYTLSLRHQLKSIGVAVYEIAPPSTDTELGHERRADKTQSHGGAPIAEVIAEAMEGLKADIPEIAVGQSKGMRAKREELFDMMNNR